MQVEGRNPVLEVLRSDKKVSIIFIQNNLKHTDKIKEIVSLAHKKGVRIRKIGKNQIQNKSKTKNHQGIIAATTQTFHSLREVIAKTRKNREKPFFVILNQVLYQQNLGAIIRSAECAGCNGVIIPKSVRMTEESIRASMGATEHISIIRENLFNAMRILKEEDIKIVGLEAEGESYIYDANLTGAIAFVIGGEHSGVTKSIMAKCDIVIKIPIFGKIGSLNMSNAAAIALFEKVRQEIYISSTKTWLKKGTE